MGCQPWHPALFQNSGLPSVGSLLEAPVIWYEFERMPLPGQYRGLTGDQRAYGEGHLPLRPQTVSAECQATKTPQSFLPASAATWREWLGAIGSCCSWPLPLLPLLSQVGRIKGRAHGGGAAAAGLKSECAREGGGGGSRRDTRWDSGHSLPLGLRSRLQGHPGPFGERLSPRSISCSSGHPCHLMSRASVSLLG